MPARDRWRLHALPGQFVRLEVHYYATPEDARRQTIGGRVGPARSGFRLRLGEARGVVVAVLKFLARGEECWGGHGGGGAAVGAVALFSSLDSASTPPSLPKRSLQPPSSRPPPHSHSLLPSPSPLLPPASHHEPSLSLPPCAPLRGTPRRRRMAVRGRAGGRLPLEARCGPLPPALVGANGAQCVERLFLLNVLSPEKSLLRTGARAVSDPA